MKAALTPSSSSIAIHAATASDTPVIQSLAHRIWPVCFGPIIAANQIANMLERIYSTENLAREMQEGHRFSIAYDGEAPIGYVSTYKEGDAVWLKKLYLSPAYQGKGVGKAMMHTAIAAFLPAAEVRLLVNNGNAPAHQFYECNGFKRMAEVPVMMGDNAFIDYLYVKTLKTEK